MITGQVGRCFRRGPLVAHLDQCTGRTLGALDVNKAFDKTIGHPKVTGIAGDVIEQSVLFLKSNSKKEPDIGVDGVQYEVKTTGVRENKKKKGVIEAKEPMSITAVSPASIVGEDFWKSAFLHKVEHMLIFYYLYSSASKVSSAEYAKFPLLTYQFHEYSDFTDEEQRTLERDWTQVRNFITHLQNLHPEDYQLYYPLISSELRKRLLLLDTAPKWPHPPRFRFKRTFVSSIYQRHVSNSKTKHPERLPDEYIEIRDLEDKCEALTRQYKGKTIDELCDLIGVRVASTVKSIAEPVIVRMFGGHHKKMRDIDLFRKIGLLGKSIVLTSTGSRTEDTKLFTLDFDEFANPDAVFEDSQLYEFFSSCRILFVVFEEPSMNAPLTMNRFMGFKMVAFDEEFINQKVRPVWSRVKYLIQTNALVDEPVLNKNGVQRRNKNGELSSAPNFPKSRDGVVFIRGTGNDSKDKRETVNGIRMYYQQVWVKGSYLASIVDDVLMI